MSDIVRDQSRQGRDKKIGTDLGMDKDDVLRLQQMSGVT